MGRKASNGRVSVIVRLLEEEAEQLDLLAEANHNTLNGYIRHILAEHAKQYAELIQGAKENAKRRTFPSGRI